MVRKNVPSIEGRHLGRRRLAVKRLARIVDRTIEVFPDLADNLLVGRNRAFRGHPERMGLDSHVGSELALLALGGVVGEAFLAITTSKRQPPGPAHRQRQGSSTTQIG